MVQIIVYINVYEIIYKTSFMKPILPHPLIQLYIDKKR